MPSAANNKSSNEKQAEGPQQGALAEPSTQNMTPLRQAITIIEHKIRNLEKRKSKLESYKELQNAGKELNADQKQAVAKFNEVINTLDFARDLCKQFLGIANVSEKEAKKSAKKEATIKYQSDLARLREILLVQDALNQMGNESVREDFLNGKNGAANLVESDLKLLDDLYPAVTPKHEIGNPVAFTNEVQAAAEHLLAVVDGKPKEVFGGSYSQIKEILGKIHESGYFDQAQVEFEAEAFVDAETSATAENLDVAEQQPELPTALDSLTIESRTTTTVLTSAVVAEQPQLEPLTATAPPPVVQPVVEPAPAGFYQQQQQQQPQPQQRLTDMLGTGSFFFLQESEIEPAATLEQIPSQTFTNQNFPLPPLGGVQHFAAPGAAPVQVQQTLQKNGVVEEQPGVLLEKGAPGGGALGAQFYANNYNARPRQQQQQQRNGQAPRGAVNNRH